MEKMIAVLIDDYGQITDAIHANYIIIYSKKDNIWEKAERLTYLPNESNNKDCEDINYIRSLYKSMILDLKECRIIIGTKITGLAYSMYTNADFVILESDSFHVDMLDEIYDAALCADCTEESISYEQLEPHEQEEKGSYYLDFKTMKSKVKGVTSKQVIRPFLHKRQFDKLTIRCDHKMPWLEGDLIKLKLKCKEKQELDSVILTIQKDS